MARDQMPDDRELHELLNAAFTSPAAWRAFEADVRRNLGRRELEHWVTHGAPLLRTQLVRRATHPAGVPGRWANGAIEDPIRITRKIIGNRAWTLRNRTRLNLLLDLVRLRINKLDPQAAYGTAIRKHLDATGGRPVHTAAIADQDDAHGLRVHSLRAWLRPCRGVPRSRCVLGDRASAGPTASGAGPAPDVRRFRCPTERIWHGPRLLRAGADRASQSATSAS